MNKFSILLSVLITFCANTIFAQNSNNNLIFKDTTNRIILVVSDENSKATLLSGKRLNNSTPFAQKIFNELNCPFYESLIRINQCSRNFSSNNIGPNVLFLSKNEGGFPRHGLLVKDEEKDSEYPNLNFVDLVVSENMFKNGALSIYSHELGHVMMMNIMEDFPNKKTSKQHVSMGVTDYFTAFSEGWGIHFQRFGFDNIPLYKNGFERMFDPNKTNKLWHSSSDENMRINTVFNNGYIYKKLLPTNIDLDSLTAEQTILLEHTSTIFDFTKLKNAQQMLSCEGVLATIFYRINSDTLLQNKFQNNEFYNRFLQSPIPNGVTPKDIFSPFENIMLKNFWVWNKIKTRDFNKDQILISFIEEWCNSFPEDKNQLLTLFISITVGKTVDNSLGDVFEKMSWYGNIGDINKYMYYRKIYNEIFLKLGKEVISDIRLLGKNIGPELWIENCDVPVRTTLWDEKRKKPLNVNINTASEYEIASFWKMDISKAKLFIKKRDEIGYYKSFEEAASYGYTFN